MFLGMYEMMYGYLLSKFWTTCGEIQGLNFMECG
jgi:hypothetical protein